MGATNNKPTISDLCSEASLYLQTFQHILGVPNSIPQHVTNAVNNLHHVIGAIRKDEVHSWLFKNDDEKGLVCRFDFIEADPIDLVKRTIATLKHLWIEIRDRGEIIEQIDRQCDEVWLFCEDWAEWLQHFVPILENGRQVAYNTTPTDKEKRWLRFLLQWKIDRWLKVFIDSNESLSLIGKRRLLQLALATDGIDEQKRARLQEALSQVEDQIEHQQQVPTTATRTTKTRDKTFSDLIQYRDKEALLKRLHFLIDGKSGADVGAVLLKAQQQGYLTECPTKAEYESEFSLVGSWQAIHNYMNPGNSNALVKANKIIIF